MKSSTQAEALDVLVIGTGFSGICAGIELLRRGIRNFRIVDKNSGIGGTWYDNTYPGAACDVPSHFYCYSFEPNPNWSRIYSPQAEIQRYIEFCADKYGLRPYIVFDATVSELRLDEKAGHWAVSFENGSVLESRHVINGMGVLHKPSIPDVEGKVSFSGQAMHTARWNHSVDFNDRRVAIIGSAASAVQVVPQIAKAASKLTVFQRTPNYIASRGDRQYSDKEKQRFAKWPWVQRLYRWMIHKRMDMLLYPLTRRDSRIGRMAARKIKKRMRASVDDPDLHAALSPDYDMGCKRILLSDDFFEALNRDNVELVDRTIAAIETNGVRSDDGRLHEVDIIVYATGFDIEGHMRSIQVYGRAGKSLHDEWRDGPRAYLGASMVGFPNYWMTTGPNTGVGTTSAVYTIEESIRHITNLIEASECRYLVDTQRSSQDAYNESIETAFEQTVWSSGCDSYYIGKSGRILTLYPYNAARFRSQLASVSLNDFKLENAEGEHED